MAWSMYDFRVVTSGVPATTKAVLRIGKQKFAFSPAAISEMGYPPYVQMLISEDATKLVIRPYEEQDITTIPFFIQRYSKKNGRYEDPKAVSIADKPLIQDIRRKLNWSDEQMVCVPMRFKESPNALFFELNRSMTAEEMRRQKRQPHTIENYPTLTAFTGVSPIALPLAVNV